VPLNEALGDCNAVVLCTQCLNVLLNERPHARIFPKVLHQQQSRQHVRYKIKIQQNLLKFWDFVRCSSSSVNWSIPVHSINNQPVKPFSMAMLQRILPPKMSNFLFVKKCTFCQKFCQESGIHQFLPLWNEGFSVKSFALIEFCFNWFPGILQSVRCFQFVPLPGKWSKTFKNSQCINHRPLPTFQISFKLEKLFVDAGIHTDGMYILECCVTEECPLVLKEKYTEQW